MEVTWEGRDGADLARKLGLPGLELHGAIPSTSDRVRALAREGLPPWSAVLADAQTAGRGRRGRGWVSPPGLGVWVSLALPAGGLDVDALLPLRMVSALARRLEEAGAPATAVKWPNDLLWPDGGKVAGILTERITLRGGGTRVVLGVGVNVLGVHPGAASVGGALLDRWEGAARLPVLAAVVEAARDARALRDHSLGTGELEAWSSRDALVDRDVVVEGTGEGELPGRVRGIDPRGRLLLETGKGVRHLASGTVRIGSSRRP